ncbi:MAG TPA: NAD-dependent epimerase/dehydratase family protein [Pirellulales bacterium]|nr:NAD-dependent epimerase/dehydratase family protein [Pirellulales bacterium]
MKILVTGATGFLGTALCARLRADGHDVTGLGSRQCDLTRQGALGPWDDCRFERIYHLAAWTQAGDFCIHHPAEQWIKNQQINTQVLAWWQAHQPRAKLIAMGTSCAYSPGNELVEKNYLDGPPIESLFTYAMTKRMLYVGLQALAKQFGLRYLCLVPSTLYGPGYHTDGRQMHFIFDLIRKILRGKLLDEPVVLWGDGHQSRELVFIDDFVDAAVRLTERADDELINVGAGAEYPIRHFAELICRHVGYDFGSIQFDASRYVGARSKCLDVRKLDRYLPGFARTPLETGLAKTVDWFHEHALEAQASRLPQAARAAASQVTTSSLSKGAA